jgi:hypothetical protein
MNKPNGGDLAHISRFRSVRRQFVGFELGRRQWIGIVLVAVSFSLLTLTGGGGG